MKDITQKTTITLLSCNTLFFCFQVCIEWPLEQSNKIHLTLNSLGSLVWYTQNNFVRTLCMQLSYGTKINMRRFLDSTIRHCKKVWRIYWIKLDKKNAYLFGQNLEISDNVDGLGTYLFLGEQRNSYHERRSYAIYKILISVRLWNFKDGGF